MKSLQGQLLAASPYMGNTSFARTVILILQHSDEGAFGVVLNRPVNETIKALWQKLSQEPCRVDRFVNMGGPVSGPVLAIHTVKPLGEFEVPPGVYLAAQREHLELLVQQTEHPFRLFIGHAGWGQGQLENELSQGAWLTTPATRELIFAENEDLWSTVVRRIGRSIIRSALNIKHMPNNVTLN